MSQNKSLLIIEDDPDLMEMLSAYFHVQGYDILKASWGEDGVQLAQDKSPDLILQDIRLPDINGFEVVERLRADRRTQSIPVIFLTEKRERRDRLRGLELGAVDYVTKPFDVQELRLRVRNVIKRSEFKTLVNPVTNLPEGQPVRERLEVMFQEQDWGIVLAGIQGLNHFRDQYGFVASDDVARAVGLMISNAVQDGDNNNIFVGHVDMADFLIITSADKAASLAKQCEKRLAPSLPYFYPAADRDRVNVRPVSERLSVSVETILAHQGNYHSIGDLQDALSI